MSANSRAASSFAVTVVIASNAVPAAITLVDACSGSEFTAGLRIQISIGWKDCDVLAPEGVRVLIEKGGREPSDWLDTIWR